MPLSHLATAVSAPPAAQQAREILHSEEIHQHLRGGGVGPYFSRRDLLPGRQHRRHQLHQHEHKHRRNGPRDHEHRHRDAHDLPRPTQAPHVGHGSGDGHEHQRHHHAEHHVDEHRPQGLHGFSRLGQQLAEQAAGEHGQQHHGQKSIVFQHSFLFHRPSPFRSPLSAASAGPVYVPG